MRLAFTVNASRILNFAPYKKEKVSRIFLQQTFKPQKPTPNTPQAT
jgi:hypothetical protein